MLPALSSSTVASFGSPTVRTNESATRPAASGATTPEQAGESRQPARSQKTASADPAIQREIARYQSTDSKVRAHEAAHLAAAQGLALGAASFGYETGPDGKRYAVSGEVNIDTSAGSTPEETLAKAEQIRRAALAPADPSAQDHAVAAMADSMAAKARLELAREQAAHYAQGSGNSPGRQIDVSV